jgi:O-succinylbenzoate synthase
VIVARSLEDAGAPIKVRLIEARTTLKTPVLAAKAEHRERRLIYLAIDTQHGRGMGELATVEQPSWGDPTTEAVLAHLVELAIPRLFEAAAARENQALPSFAVGPLSNGSRIDAAAGSLVEMALLDAELRVAGVSMAQWLGLTRTHVDRGATIGGSSEAEMKAVAAEALDTGATRLRVKIDPRNAFERAQWLRAVSGESIQLQLDANGSFTADEASREILQSLSTFDLTCIEQPLLGGDLTAVAALRSSIDSPIFLDESVASQRTISDIARYGAADGVCIKPVRFGGIRGTVAAVTQAQRSGLSVFMGGMFESGLGRSALQTLAGLDGVTGISDTTPADTYLAHDPCAREPSASGNPELWAEPGVGPWPEGAVLTTIAEFLAP